MGGAETGRLEEIKMNRDVNGKPATTSDGDSMSLVVLSSFRSRLRLI